MDPITAVLCGVGALAAFDAFSALDGATSLLTACALALGLLGVARAQGSGPSKALPAVPLVAWVIHNFWEFVPDRVEQAVKNAAPILVRAPTTVSLLALGAGFVVMVLLARARIGAALATATLVTLGLFLLFRLVPERTGTMSDSDNAFWSLVHGIDLGWSTVLRRLIAASFFSIGVGALPVPALPKRGAAIAGAIGALLLAALVSGMPPHIPPWAGYMFAVIGLPWLAAHILLAVGLAAIAKLGAKGAGWGGMALVIVGALGTVLSLAVFSGRSAGNTLGFSMAIPFALLGLGVALFGWKDAPLATGRRLLAAVFVAAFAAGTIAWIAVYLSLAGAVGSREPAALALLLTFPLARLGLPLFAALLLYLAAPPVTSNRRP